MLAIKRVHVILLSERDFPEVSTKVATPSTATFGALLESAQDLNPGVSAELLIRAVWEAGLDEVKKSLAKRRLPATIALKSGVVGPEKSKAARR